MMPYIINVALVMAGCLIFYKILLQKETFYRVNRFVLAACLLISFSLPLVPVPQQWSLRKAEPAERAYSIPPTPAETVASPETPIAAQQQPMMREAAPAETASFSFNDLMTWMVRLYWFGVILFGLNFLFQVFLLVYRAYRNPVIIDGRYRIVEISGDKAPCSFGNIIFINPEKYDWETYEQIIQHEKVHVRQKHSIDIMLAEIVLVFQWFNPFAWLYRKEVETNLEFLTDDDLVQNSRVEKSSYQLSLLKVSAPHFPLSLTTNYNQSLLKKRILMMNAKKSNVHTGWKYFFLLPLLVFFASVLNRPVVYAQEPVTKKEKIKPSKGPGKNMNISGNLATEGQWFATIKDGEISIQFKQDENDASMNQSSFGLSLFPDLPRGTAGTFKLTREAGTMEFTGKFEGDQGMGRYKFISDKDYAAHMARETGEELNDQDQIVFFFVDVKKSYVQMLKSEGFTRVAKHDLIPLVALDVNREYISSIRQSGFKEFSIHDLIPMRALGINGAYITEIRNAGYPNITMDKLVAFKSQGIDASYLAKVRSTVRDSREEKAAADDDSDDNNIVKDKDKNKNKEKDKSGKKHGDDDDAYDIIAMKAMEVDEAYINSLKLVGYSGLQSHDLVAMKSVGVTPEFIKLFQAAGYKDISPSKLITLKAQDITPEYIKGYEALGFKNITLNDIIPVKAMGITPAYITSMREKGFNYTDLQKYIQLKSID
jgi:hypothetical protein